MAKSASNELLIGILAIIAGVLVLLNFLSLNLVVGIFLIIYGLLAIIRR
jgi:uncharacterized membrane protein HdeD (DUF308 family)